MLVKRQDKAQIEILAGSGNSEEEKLFAFGYSQLEIDIALENSTAFPKLKLLNTYCP